MSLSTDPIDFLLDDDGDIVIPLTFSRGLQASAQSVRIALLLFRGEWFLDQLAGVPYLAGVTVPAAAALLGQRFNAEKARNAFRDAILGAYAVVELTRLDVAFDPSTRAMQVAYEARTEFGDLVDSLELV